MRDFTLHMYEKLINTIKDAKYEFQTFEEYIQYPKKKVVVMRHDCDIWPENDLKIAKIEYESNVNATYYFRIPRTFNKTIIRKIINYGHEIGYHYENLADTKGDYEKAIASFIKNLEELRKIYPVKTVAMHGRPLSKWDSRLLWNKYNLEDYGLIGEPYISINYNDVFYLTDTGSRWNGDDVSIRDTVNTNTNYYIKSTFQLIEYFQNNKLPDRIIINAHAARWNNNMVIWLYRYLLQKSKNTAKKLLKYPIYNR